MVKREGARGQPAPDLRPCAGNFRGLSLLFSSQDWDVSSRIWFKVQSSQELDYKVLRLNPPCRVQLSRKCGALSWVKRKGRTRCQCGCVKSVTGTTLCRAQ